MRRPDRADHADPASAPTRRRARALRRRPRLAGSSILRQCDDELSVIADHRRAG